MHPIPDVILMQFEAILAQKSVPAVIHDNYRMWLRYYFDFSIKYQLPDERSERVRLFIERYDRKARQERI